MNTQVIKGNIALFGIGLTRLRNISLQNQKGTQEDPKKDNTCDVPYLLTRA